MDRRSLLTRTAALCSAAAAAVHFGVAREHFAEWWLAGLFFIACAGWQATWSVLVWNRTSTGLLATGAVSNLAIVMIWLATRTFGLPLGPDAGAAEAVGVADVVATVLEVAVAVLAGLLLLLDPTETPHAYPRGPAVGMVAGFAALMLLTSCVALAAPAGHEHERRGGPHQAHEAHRQPNLPDVSRATERDTANATKLLADSIARTKGYRDTTKAEDAGYDVTAAVERWERKHPGADEDAPIRALHVGKRDNRKDGEVADPSAPETLIYRRGEDGKLALVGVMYVVGKRDGQPPQVAGPYTRWHTHKARAGKDGRRAAMMHVWFVLPDELEQAYARKPPAKALEAYQETLS